MTPVHATATSYMPWLLTELLNEPVETTYVALVSSTLQSIQRAVFSLCVSFCLEHSCSKTLLKDFIFESQFQFLAFY